MSDPTDWYALEQEHLDHVGACTIIDLVDAGASDVVPSDHLLAARQYTQEMVVQQMHRRPRTQMVRDTLCWWYLARERLTEVLTSRSVVQAQALALEPGFQVISDNSTDTDL